MRKLRLFLLMLLCVAVPLQGIAGVHMLSAPCPMEQSVGMAQMQIADMDQQAMADHDCCNDAETAAKTGKMCKTGQDCPVSALYPASSISSLPLSVAPTTQYLSLVLSVRTFDASSVWRPPALA